MKEKITKICAKKIQTRSWIRAQGKILSLTVWNNKSIKVSKIDDVEEI